MIKSVECLKRIIEEYGEGWKKQLAIYLDGEREDEGIGEDTYFLQFMNAYKEDVISGNVAELRKVEKLIYNDLLYNDLRLYMDQMLNVYYAIEPLRILEIKDYDKAVQLVDYIFEQNIVRYNIDAAERYQEYGLESEEHFVDIAGVLDSMCNFVVSNNFHINTINKIAYQNTRLSKNLCKYVAEKVDMYFEQLRMKLILEGLPTAF